jgi:hypothetical protein
LRAENDDLHIKLDEEHVRLLYSRICLRSEAQGRLAQAQIRHTIQQGLDAVQKAYFQLATNYKSKRSSYDEKTVKLLEDIGNAKESKIQNNAKPPESSFPR